MSYPTLFATPGMRAVAEAIDAERQRQLAKFGEQHHTDGTGYEGSDGHADFWRQRCQEAFADGEGTWGHVLLEEVFEAMAEANPAKLRAELVQVAAVCAAWITDLDTRPADDHVCNSVMARGEMDEPLGYWICGVCGTRKDGAQR